MNAIYYLILSFVFYECNNASISQANKMHNIVKNKEFLITVFRETKYIYIFFFSFSEIQ